MDPDRLHAAPLEAWFCANCSRPAVGDRCPSCGWVLPPLDAADESVTVDDETGEFEPLKPQGAKPCDRPTN